MVKERIRNLRSSREDQGKWNEYLIALKEKLTKVGNEKINGTDFGSMNADAETYSNKEECFQINQELSGYKVMFWIIAIKSWICEDLKIQI